MRNFLIFILTISSVYGQDFGLSDVANDPRPLVQELSKSTAAMVPATLLFPVTDKVIADLETYVGLSDDFNKANRTTQKKILEAFSQEAKKADKFLPLYIPLEMKGYCSNFSLKDEVTLSNCTGTLISDRHILTAGHCADIDLMCENYKWVFDYKKDTDGKLSTFIKKKEVYNCKKIVKSINVNLELGIPTTIYRTFFRTDFSIIELDRAVEGRNPVKLSSNKLATPGKKVFSISHPLGMPAKVHTSVSVGDFLNSKAYFWTDLVVFGGSSGGPIFDDETGEIVGVISKGAKTTVRDEVNNCRLEAIPKNNSSLPMNSNAQMRKILKVIKRKKIPVNFH